MPRFKAGIAGPIPLADGRVVTADQGEFELEPQDVEGGEPELAPHDADLIERGAIVLSEVVRDEGGSEGVEPKAPVKSTPPAAPGVPAASGEKAGA
jgi:hypothetical protein